MNAAHVLTAPDELRLSRAPQCEPPFDDEPGGGTPPEVHGQLRLVRFPSPDPPPGRVAQLAPLPAAPAEADEPNGDRTPRALLPDPESWAARFAQALAEVLATTRTARQLMRWTTWPLYQELESSVGAFGGPARPVLRMVRVTEPADGVAEACAVFRLGPRVRAVALRFEGLDGHWRCTAAQLG